jgi:hypothetical protein
MYIHISKHVRIYITPAQHQFLYQYQDRDSFLQSELPIESAQTAKTLADKGILVKKKLDTDTQYALNKHIKFTQE